MHNWAKPDTPAKIPKPPINKDNNNTNKTDKKNNTESDKQSLNRILDNLFKSKAIITKMIAKDERMYKPITFTTHEKKRHI